MARWLLRGGLLALLVVSGCAVKGRAKVTSGEAAAREEAPPASDSPATLASAAGATTAATTTPSAPAPTAAEPVRPAPGCSLVCNAANKGRVAAADEARLTSGLAEITQALRQCVRSTSPSMTLRFDSTGALTGFGVDHEPEEHGEGGCIDAINARTPTVTYAGPATVRCAERCVR